MQFLFWVFQQPMLLLMLSLSFNLSWAFLWSMIIYSYMRSLCCCSSCCCCCICCCCFCCCCCCLSCLSCCCSYWCLSFSLSLSLSLSLVCSKGMEDSSRPDTQTLWGPSLVASAIPIQSSQNSPTTAWMIRPLHLKCRLISSGTLVLMRERDFVGDLSTCCWFLCRTNRHIAPGNIRHWREDRLFQSFNMRRRMQCDSIWRGES